MKKILSFLVLTIFLVICECINVKADNSYTNSDIANELLTDLRTRLNNKNIGTTNDFLGIASFWNSNPNYILLISGQQGDYIYRVGNITEINGTSIKVNGTGYYTNFYTSRGNIFYSGELAEGSYAMSNPIEKGTLVEFMPMIIDYENYVYDQSIYVPNIKAVFTGTNPSQMAQSNSIPVEFEIDNQTSISYGIETQFKFWIPRDIYFSYTDGGAVYNQYTHYQGYFFNGISMQDDINVPISSNQNNGLYIIDMQDYVSDWTSAYNAESQLQNFSSNVANYSSSENAYKRFNKNALKMGNRLEIWVRYYYIDDGIVYAGDWRHWISEAPQKQDIQTGVNYVSGKEVEGESNQVTPTEQEISTEMSNPITILPSSQNVEVTVINQVPNNQNYPTLSAYQNDNILLDTMNRATDIMDWLNGTGQFTESSIDGATNGGFGAFLGACFGFIPWYIWAVIAVGFGFSIIIMVIKVL